MFGQIEPSEFERCFRAWTRRVEEKTDGQVARVDGKTLRGSRDRAPGEGPLHLVEAGHLDGLGLRSGADARAAPVGRRGQ
ncbi:hypothetical protein [Salinibacter sp.]|uniref:hypothetical protein n=1 Tax=Salinibacter sp. TaxID=2065818 RepID=UPI003FA709CB